jgi:hypothetical protein
MKKCVKCNVLHNTTRKSCPLCFEILQDVDGQNYQGPEYPKPTPIPEKYNVLLRIITFLSIVAIFSSVLVNILTYKNSKSLWSLIVVLGVLYFWVLLRSTFKAKSNVPMRLVIQMVTLSIHVIGIDLVTGVSRWSLSWSINYVIPFLSMASLLAIISMFLGKVRSSEYLLYLLAAAILGLIPFVLWLFDLVIVLWPSLAAASLSFATIVGMIVFADKETKEELKKRFHI